MNKIIIPSLLVAVVAIAGMFAFTPVEQVSTVHTLVQDEMVTFVNVVSNDFDVTSGDIMTVNSATNRPFQVFGMQCVTADAEQAEDIDVMTTRIGTANTGIAGAPATSMNDPGTSTTAGLRVNMMPTNAAGSFVVPAGQSLFFTIPTTADGDNDDNDSLVCNLQIKAASDAAITAVIADP